MREFVVVILEGGPYHMEFSPKTMLRSVTSIKDTLRISTNQEES